MKRLLKLSALAIAALVLTNCNCVKKMARDYKSVKITCAPEVLELNNGVIPADLTVEFPANYFNPKAIIKITPVLVYEGGETAAEPRFFQGTKVNDNYTVVGDAPARFTHHVEFAYKPEMNTCELQLRVEAKCAGSKSEFVTIDANAGAGAHIDDDAELTKEELTALATGGEEAQILRQKSGVKAARGLNIMQSDLIERSYANYMSTMAHGYERQTVSTDRTDILYKINDSKVDRNAEQAPDMADFRANIDRTAQNGRASQKITVDGYASPDGPEGRNVELSEARSQSAKAFLAKMLKDSGLDVDASAYGEDWDGLYEAVAASNVKDKDMILQILRMYKDKPSAVRESELRNLTGAFEELKSDVLPGLRRAKIVNTTTTLGRTDDEMLALARAGKYEELSLEELRYVGEIAPDNETKQGALEYAATTYNDATAYNNLGVVYASNRQHEKAAEAFRKSAQLGGSATELSNNLALLNIGIGNIDEAKPYLNSANDQVKSLASAAEGDYAAASRTLEGIDAAMAQVMEGNYAAAKRSIANDQSAAADYLRAVIAAKEGDKITAINQIRSAVRKDPKLAAKAATDVNLADIRW